MRQAAFFSDNNFQDYEFTRLNTYKKKEMSEELTIILSNNYYWNQPLARRSQFLAIIGNYCPKKLRRREETSLYKIILCSYLTIKEQWLYRTEKERGRY